MGEAGKVRIILRISAIVLVCCLDLSIGFPTEQPTKFSLNTDDAGTTTTSPSQATSRLDQGRELLGRAADAIRIGAGRFINSVTLARNILVDQAETLASESQNQFTTILSAKSDASNNSRRSLELTTNPPIIETAQNSRDTVKLYTEGGQGLLERPITKPFMEMLEAFFKPTPLVDNIKEREKYGNNGDKFIGIGRALVSSLEGFSNFLNSVIEVPRNTARKASRGLTEALNHVGARIIGLE
ncbi:uncharacterized protein LOC143207161 isoform X1 [Lasioglossum baleicum]|uniref:uncharacterized protein LOC143207161 isoform X1 n=1 Tax=Lasioglossum baleicum TaxID=434251 RepID=UPI003FCC83E8